MPRPPAVCGTFAGYKRHLREGTPTCAACRRENARRQNLRRMGVNTDPRVPALGTQRRIRALQRMGWPMKVLITEFGMQHIGSLTSIFTYDVVKADTEARVREVFERLEATPGPSSIAAKRAAGRGYAPPAAWDDIDDPNESPKGVAVA